jgi:hypothetical protein
MEAIPPINKATMNPTNKLNNKTSAIAPIIAKEIRIIKNGTKKNNVFLEFLSLVII